MNSKNFDQVCRNIDWSDMAAARRTIKNLAVKKSELKYLVKFLDELCDAAIDSHGVNLNTVYPSSVKAILVVKAKKHKN